MVSQGRRGENHAEKVQLENVLNFFQVSTGTTLVAVEFDGGVVIGADSRTSMVTFCLILASELFQLSSGHLGRQQGD